MRKTIVEKRVRLSENDTELCIMQLEKADEEYHISFLKGTPEKIGPIQEIIQGVHYDGQNDDKLTYWSEILLALEEARITVTELPSRDMQLKFYFDATTGDKLVQAQNTTTDGADVDDIARNIANSLSQLFSNFGIDQVNEIETAVEHKDIAKAFARMEECRKNGFLHFGSKTAKSKLFQVIQHIDMSGLNPEQRKNTYEIKFVLGESIKKFSSLYEDVDKYLDEFREQVDQNLAVNLLLMKANAASQQGRHELAYGLYQQVLKESSGNYGTLAWAHRGLALTLGYDDPDALHHESMAADAFLLAGLKDQFVQSKVALAEHAKNSDPDRAIQMIEEAIAVFNVENPIQKDKIAALSLRKAMFYQHFGKLENALKEAQHSLELREGHDQFGNEAKRIASINAIIQFEAALDTGKSQGHYETKISQLEQFMLDTDKPSYTLHKRLADALDSKDVTSLEDLQEEVLQEGDVQINVLYWLSLVIIQPELNLKDKLELLERSWSEANKRKVDNDLKSNVCSLFAEVYKDHGIDEKAIIWYQKSLKYNPFLWPSRQNYVALLWKHCRWENAVSFLQEQRKLLGDLPNLLFALGKSLVEAGESKKAIHILHLAKKAKPEAEYIRQYLDRAMEELRDEFPIEPETTSNLISMNTVTIAEIEQCLDDFVRFIESDKRMTFWYFDADDKKHKWIPSPEQHGQNLLHTFVKSRFASRVEAIEEVDTGAGRIDVYLLFQNGLRTVVELKMCGNRYSEGYALEGIPQLVHYLKNKQTHRGYLIVFDGRTRDCGKGILSHYFHEDYTIRSFVSDVRPKVK